MRAVVRAMDGDHCTASWRNVFFNVWADRVTIDAVTGIHRTILEMLGDYPDGVAIFGVSRPGVAAVPGAQERAELARMLGDTGPRLRCIASVIQGEGFVSAAKRTVMSTISMLARQPCPLKIFDEEPDAARWMCPLLGQPDGEAVEPADLVAVIEEIDGDYRRFLGSSG